MSLKLMGRYDVIDELGRGPQSVVYLAKDTRMSRQVTIKKIGPGSLAQNEALLREARAAGNLHHQNIIPLYDLGVVEGAAYLVYAHVSGEPLSHVLKRSGMLSVPTAVRIVVDVLDALASAHSQGILHLDVKPSNVIVSASGEHFLMDFGIARAMLAIPNAQPGADRMTQYMAPETITAQGVEPRSDIYSVAMLLQEMVKGAAATQEMAGAEAGASVKMDDKLEAIIAQASAQKIAERYTSALELRQTLLEYLDACKQTAGGIPDADIASTLRFLLRRIRSKSDFPAISGVINEINQIVASESEDSSRLAQVILQDFALTNKLLRLVNAVSYSQFGGKINTISKAVSILGFETVRNISMSLILIDFFDNKSQAEELKDVVISSFFSGIVAVQLAEWKSAQEVEEAMICAMFFNLGRMLTRFYFFDESEEITRIMASQSVDEEAAAKEVLGVSYNELGLGIARSWNFPDSLIAGMQKLKGGAVIEPANTISRLNVAVNMANELCAITAVDDPTTKGAALIKIRTRYASVSDTTEEKLASALNSGLQDLSQRSRVLGMDTSKSPVVKKMQQWVAHAVTASSPQSVVEPAGMAAVDLNERQDTQKLLRDGLQDVTNTMAGEYKLNDVLQMVLETIYRGLGFRYVLIFSRDSKKNMMMARFGFGEKVIEVLPGFHFSLNFEADVFHLSLAKGLDIVIEDVGAPNITNKIPAWHSKAVDSRSFFLLPMMINNAAIGLIYADMLEAKKLKISPEEMAWLRDLRNQAVLAIQQKT